MLKWYKLHRQELDKIQIVGIPPDTGRYRVNFDSVRRYLSEFRGTGLFTERFLRDKYSYFQRCEARFAKTHQNDGPPEGLDTDLLLYTQEANDALLNYQALKIEVGTAARAGERPARIKSIYLNLIFLIKKVGGRCLIDAIDFSKEE
jgi:hypothetical protein